MTSKKRDFYGKEVADAIKKACEELKVPQEQLEIEVIETGSTGIFGLIRKKAHISAVVKGATSEKTEDVKEPSEPAKPARKKPVKKSRPKAPANKAPAKVKEEEPIAQEPVVEKTLDKLEERDDEDEFNGNGVDEQEEVVEELTEQSLDLIKDELQKILELMGYPATIEIESKGIAVTCQVGNEHEEALTGQEGKTLDSLQYLLRKIIARKIPNRLRLTVDVGNYREKRLSELKVRAVELAEKVKEDGKTQVIPALSPSERRIVHMSLQEDKEIRSRSVGEGLFKKILIYKPGKGGNKGSGKRRGNSRGRKNNNYRKKSE